MEENAFLIKNIDLLDSNGEWQLQLFISDSSLQCALMKVNELIILNVKASKKLSKCSVKQTKNKYLYIFTIWIISLKTF